MIQIQNSAQLIENGESETLRKARTIILEMFEKAVNAVDPQKIVKSKISLNRNILRIEG